MGIIVHNQDVQADVSFLNGALAIAFRDPSYVRCDRILVDADSRHIGGILHEGYHDFGVLPGHIRLKEISLSSRANLSGVLPTGHAFCLSAPIEFSSHTKERA